MKVFTSLGRIAGLVLVSALLAVVAPSKQAAATVRMASTESPVIYHGSMVNRLSDGTWIGMSIEIHADSTEHLVVLREGADSSGYQLECTTVRNTVTGVAPHIEYDVGVNSIWVVFHQTGVGSWRTESRPGEGFLTIKRLFDKYGVAAVECRTRLLRHTLFFDAQAEDAGDGVREALVVVT